MTKETRTSILGLLREAFPNTAITAKLGTCQVGDGVRTPVCTVSAIVVVVNAKELTYNPISGRWKRRFIDPDEYCQVLKAVGFLTRRQNNVDGVTVIGFDGRPK